MWGGGGQEQQCVYVGVFVCRVTNATSENYFHCNEITENKLSGKNNDVVYGIRFNIILYTLFLIANGYPVAAVHRRWF